MKFGVKVIIIVVALVIAVIPITIYKDMTSPKPEIIDYQQFSTYPGDGYHRMHNVNVTVNEKRSLMTMLSAE